MLKLCHEVIMRRRDRQLGEQNTLPAHALKIRKFEFANLDTAVVY